MDLRKASKIVDSKVASAITTGEKGAEEKRKFRNFFKGTNTPDKSEEIRRKLSDSLKSNEILRTSNSNLKSMVATLKKKLKDAVDQNTEYKDLVATFKNEKQEAEQRLLELNKAIEEAKSIPTPFNVEYNTVEEVIKLGSEERENFSYSQFIDFCQLLVSVFPHIKIKLSVEEIEAEASKVKDSLEPSWNDSSIKEFVDLVKVYPVDPSQDNYNTIEKLANQYGSVTTKRAVKKLADEEDKKTVCKEILTTVRDACKAAKIQIEDTQESELDKAVEKLNSFLEDFTPKETLNEVKLEELPENFRKVYATVASKGYLPEGMYDEYAPQVKEELRAAGKSVPSFALLADSTTIDAREFKKILKEKGLMDSWKKIPGTPSMMRISDSENKSGMQNASVIKAGNKFILFQ